MKQSNVALRLLPRFTVFKNKLSCGSTKRLPATSLKQKNMKILCTASLLCITMINCFAQTNAEKQMEKQAREMFRVVTINDKSLWMKFMQENFTKNLQEKPFRKEVATTNDKDVVISKSDETNTQLEAKLGLFEQLHQDFGKGKITSIKTVSNESEVNLESEGLNATLKLTFTTKAPYLIDGIKVNVKNN
jgi:hypothetical protein